MQHLQYFFTTLLQLMLSNKLLQPVIDGKKEKEKKS